MTLVLQTPLRPTEMLLALRLVAADPVARFRAAVAYTTLGGCQAVFAELARTIPYWDHVPKELITSLDFGITEPRALRYVAGLSNFTVRVVLPVATSSFHPKLYIFDSGPRRNLLVGSANLSARAFDVNCEAALVGRARASDVDHYWDQLVAGSVGLTAEILRTYESQRRRRPPPRIRIDPALPAAPPRAATSLDWFWSAVATGAVDPARHEAFWVEAGSMKSGGARNQLELPRGACRFFGSAFSGYASNAVTPIRTLTLSAGPRTFADRLLRWHGDNRMERLNLPTVAQGGFAYANRVVLFRRRSAGRFELTVHDPTDSQAVAWRRASIRARTLFKVSDRGGARGSRLCGLIS